MITSKHNRFTSLLIYASFTWCIGTVGVVSAGTIAQSPLFITSSLDPNIMFIIDDSGSMNLSFLPDSICDLGNTKRAKSSTVNGLAYDPSVTYSPPVDANGVSLGDSPFAAAWQNGYALPHPTSGTISSTGPRVNLSLQFRPTWSGNTTGCNDSDVYKGNAGPAYYYKFTPSSSCSLPSKINDESCYSSVDVVTNGTASEKQNFANWYSYYRTRLMMSKAGVSRAFAQLGATPRVGYGSINKSSSTIDGISINTIERGVRAFSGNDRTAFFTWLFGKTTATYTPLRRALDSAGVYYSYQGDKGPWSSTPGTTGGTLLGCRQSYTVLMTDGYWNDAQAGTSGARNNTDGSTSNNMTITSPDGSTYSYTPTAPFTDTVSNSLADVAMYYWKRDLCDTIPNKVSTSTSDPAFWQHMVTYGIGLGVPTAIDPTVAHNAIATKTVINWPDPLTTSSATSVSTRIDDLLHATVNSRGDFFNAKNPDSFASALNDTLSKIIDKSKSSASAVAANSTQLNTGTQVYQAKFDPKDWSGQLQAYDADAGTPATASSPAVPGTGALTPSWEVSTLIPAYSDRAIYTYNPSLAAGYRGVSFQWANLTSAQQAFLNTLDGTVDATKGTLRLNWLRGDNSNEKTSDTDTDAAHIFRKRINYLGDIINSDPIYVGHEDFGYGVLPSSEGGSYTSFRASDAYKNRNPMLYVGANDGMLHGFNANSTGGGAEVFAYIPNALFPELSKLPSLTYSHRYYVDGMSSVSDVYYDSDWHTLLVGTTGAGGRAVFALDVTNPDAFGAGSTLWEFTNTNDVDLGYTMAQPSVVRMQDGHWAVIVANGYNSDNGHAVLFILDAKTGAVLQKIDTGAGTTANKNGLSSPIAVDTNNDRSVDTIYAGDLYGNLWKFNVSGSAGSWPVPSSPLFVACTTSGTTCSAANRQPITAKPNIGKVRAPGSDQNGVGIMVYFGTGKYFETGDNLVATNPQIQTFYGLWDKGSAITDRANLQEQSISFEDKYLTAGGGLSTHPIRVVTKNPVCYAATSTDCSASSALKSGWALNLLSPKNGAEGERVISFPLVRRGLVVFATAIPDADPCKAGGRSWLMEVDALGGGEFAGAPFDTNGDGLVDENDKVKLPDGTWHYPGGLDLEVGLHKTPTKVESASGVDHGYVSGSSGNMGDGIEIGAITKTASGPGIRRSWLQLK